MKKSFEVSVNPKIIKWARENAGFSDEEIAKKIGISIENYKKIESGEKEPTFKQIEKLSRLFKRPISVFLLPEPPFEPALTTSFRILPKTENEISKELRLSIRKARYYQNIAHELINEVFTPKTQFPKVTIKNDPIYLAKKQRQECNISINEQFNFKNVYHAFNKWREFIESKNILVFQFKFPLESARGFVLMDKEPYTIVLNSADNIFARIFTLFHEYAHILLNQPEIYVEEEIIKQYPKIENWCNKFVSEFLVPEEYLIKEDDYKQFTNKSKTLGETLLSLSKRFLVSKHAVLTKFRTMDLITQEEYEEEVVKLKKEFNVKREENKVFLPSYKKCIQEKGKKFVSLIMLSKEKGVITSADATEYLSLKLKNIKKLSEIKLI